MRMTLLSLLALLLAACTQEDVKNSVTGALQAGCREMRNCTVENDSTYPGANR
jgi:hypothetical protein